MCAYCEQGPRLHSSIMEEEKKRRGQREEGGREKKEERMEGREMQRERPRDRGKEIAQRNEVT